MTGATRWRVVKAARIQLMIPLIHIYSGGKWQELQDGDWPVCQDTTTTTEPPTTTPPFMSE